VTDWSYDQASRGLELGSGRFLEARDASRTLDGSIRSEGDQMSNSAHKLRPISKRPPRSGVRGVWARVKRWLGTR
jgi:hypothetical protein